MLIRGALRSLKIRTPSPSFYSSFSPSSSTAKPDAGIVSDAAAADADAEDLLLDDDLPASAAAAAATATLPSLLQPRVVVYDGVCHLCHNGKLDICVLYVEAAYWVTIFLEVFYICTYLCIKGSEINTVAKRFGNVVLLWLGTVKLGIRNFLI